VDRPHLAGIIAHNWPVRGDLVAGNSRVPEIITNPDLHEPPGLSGDILCSVIPLSVWL